MTVLDVLHHGAPQRHTCLAERLAPTLDETSTERAPLEHRLLLFGATSEIQARVGTANPLVAAQKASGSSGS